MWRPRGPHTRAGCSASGALSALLLPACALLLLPSSHGRLATDPDVALQLPVGPAPAPAQPLRQPAAAAGAAYEPDAHTSSLHASGAIRGTANCTAVTSTSLTVAWPGAPADADLFYVALAASASAKPFALQTTASAQLTLHDLLPATTYWLRWRAHPRARTPGRNIGWDWMAYRPAFSCITSATRSGVAHSLRRLGRLAEDSIGLSWSHPAGPTNHQVRFRLVPESADEAAATWTTRSSARGNGRAYTLRHLRPGREYEVAVRAVVLGEAFSDTALFRTAAAGYAEGKVRYTTMARVSEFTNDIDFLDNHDSATSAALAVLLARMAKQVNVSEACLTALAKLCPAARGQGDACLACVSGSATPPACGDKQMAKFDSHFFCGEGWPSFSMFSTPMAEYCVENTVAPVAASPTNAGGWAEYVSCDAPEAGALNHPTTPQCICWVSWDRSAVSHQPLHVYEKFCTTPQGGASTRCTCADAENTSSIVPRPGSPSTRYVGKSPVWLPYTYYTKPQEDYPNSTNVGDNFSTPKNGSCAELAKLGEGGCTWKRLPRARIIYYPDLQNYGWNSSLPRDTPADSSGSLHNIQSMAAAWRGAAAGLLSPRCCGC